MLKVRSHFVASTACKHPISLFKRQLQSLNLSLTVLVHYWLCSII